MVHGVRHTVFIRGTLGEMGFAEERMPWFCGNRGTIQTASKVGFIGRTKHVEIKLECTHEYVERGNGIEVREHEGANGGHPQEEAADVIGNEIR